MLKTPRNKEVRILIEKKKEEETLLLRFKSDKKNL